MKVSIIVPAFNEEKLLSRSLAAIQNAAKALEKEAAWELIVCDNNSTDRTAAIAEAAGAKVVFEPLNQISRARNAGAAAATGDWLVFIDADSFPTPELFDAVVLRMKDARCAGGGCLIALDEQGSWAVVAVALWNSLSRTFRWAAGSFIFCDARLFRSIGGFSTKLYATEEVDLCHRLKKAARAEGRRLVIITRQRLITSARKMHLFSPAEHLAFFLKAGLFPRRVLGNRDECVLWYNGRR